MPKVKVEITQSGRGGSIYYREGMNTVTFDWEFALSPVLAELLGTKAKLWDEKHPWAAGRQAEIFDFVAKEVVRQKTDDCAFMTDVAAGTITIFQLPAKFLDLRQAQLGRTSAKSAKSKRPKTPRSESSASHPTQAYKDFMASVPALREEWHEGMIYDIASFRKMSDSERSMVVALLAGRDLTWREVAVLAEDGSPAALAALEAATEHHLSIDTRLAAADALSQKGLFPNVEKFLARQIRLLDRPENGLERALALAEKNPSEIIKQALLWASYNATDCAPRCAKLLLTICGAAKEPLSADIEQLLAKLGLHSSYFERKAAFDELRRLVNMELDQGIHD